MIEFLIHDGERRLVGRDTNRLVRPFEWGMCLADFAIAGDGSGALPTEIEKAL